MLASTPRATANIGCRKSHRSGSRSRRLPSIHVHVHRRRLHIRHPQHQGQDQQRQRHAGQQGQQRSSPTGNGPDTRDKDEDHGVSEVRRPKPKLDLHKIDALLHKIEVDVACLRQALHPAEEDGPEAQAAQDASDRPRETPDPEPRRTRQVNTARRRPHPRPRPRPPPRPAPAHVSSAPAAAAAPPADAALGRRAPSVRVPSRSDRSGESGAYAADWNHLSGRFERCMASSPQAGCRRETFRTGWGASRTVGMEGGVIRHSFGDGDDDGYEDDEGKSEGEYESESEEWESSQSDRDSARRTWIAAGSTSYVDDGNYHPFPLGQ
ncbi:hypothetical protein E4U43_005199 [Claviceps pusilla]|uniref:Uncharacterized protein n=1 Tax=Claviceps pusilla TaxID=123648 RepID=A0A9P7NEL9_9HYPO|nr:hypothetical protein E4U43_005199 [Claviceps pusilla]